MDSQNKVAPGRASVAAEASAAARVADPCRVEALQQTGLLDSLPAAAFDRLTRLAARTLRVPVALVSLVDAHRQFFKSALGLPEPWASERETPLTHSFCQHVVASAEPLIVGDAREHPLVRDNLAVLDLGVIAYAGMPLALEGGHVIGSFCAIDTRPRDWTEDEIEILRDLAASVMTEIEMGLAARAAERQAAALRDAEAALRSANQTLEAVIQASPLAILHVDLEGKVRLWSRAAERLFGWTADEVLGRPVSTIPEDRRGELREHLERTREGGAAAGIETVRRRKDGSLVDVSLWTAPVPQAGGGVAGMVGVVADISARKQIEAERDRLLTELRAAYHREHRIAESWQRSLLSEPAEDAFPGLKVATRYESALDEARVGGDFFDVFSPEPGKVALVVGDVSGKGLDAALRTAEVKFALRAFLSEYPHPGRALARVNDYLCDTMGGSDSDGETFVALSLAVVDGASGETVFASAGAEPPAVRRAGGGVEVVDVSGLPLGVYGREEFAERAGVLAPGDLLVMTTDGITEARRGDDFLGQEGFLRLIADAPAAPLAAAGQFLLDGARSFADGSLRDDACLLLVLRR